MDSLTPLTLTKDPEFERLASCRIQSLSDRELCLAFKNNPPLIAVWQGTVLLSYRELMLCRLYNIPYEIDPRPFFCRQEAIVYICETILEEGTDSSLHLKYILGKLYEALKYLRQKERDLEISKILFADGQPTTNILKTRYGKGHYAVKNANDFAEGIDAVAEKSPVLAARILSGDIFFTVPDLQALPRINERVFTAYAASPRNKVCRQKMRQEVKRVREHPPEPPKPKEPVMRQKPQIKQTPPYDPDTELRSITLTIPAWAGSLRRACQKTAFPKTSAGARMQFRQALYTLREAILETDHMMEEARYEYR